ncbi:Fic family protein [Candidatus Micrarchaeota archaeon]|nr:Fic family protein [Candidatus Micrarchaeota archaeon]
MHVEIRKVGRKRKYYLAQSYRRDGKVLKNRVYLGVDLSAAELVAERNIAEAKLAERTGASRRISDPFEAVLSEKEIAELKTLEAKALPKIAHLSEEDWRQFTEAFTYDTNAIEGSSVDSKEVDDILEKDKWPDKPKGDISETYGVANAVDFIRKTKEHVSLPLILELHRIVFENSKPFAGKLRAKGVEVVVADQFGRVVHRGAPSTHVRRLLSKLAKWYAKNRKRYSPVVLAAVVHNQFENIHPFQDGNGRVGRLLLNNVLLKHNLPPLNIELENRREYYAALQAYENGHNLRPTVELMLKEYRSLKRMLGKR